MTAATSFTVGDIRIERIVEMEIPFVTPGEAYPDTPEHRAYRRDWLTREVQ